MMCSYLWFSTATKYMRFWKPEWINIELTAMTFLMLSVQLLKQIEPVEIVLVFTCRWSWREDLAMGCLMEVVQGTKIQPARGAIREIRAQEQQATMKMTTLKRKHSVSRTTRQTVLLHVQMSTNLGLWIQLLRRRWAQKSENPHLTPSHMFQVGAFVSLLYFIPILISSN